jgi:hypothetical protein
LLIVLIILYATKQTALVQAHFTALSFGQFIAFGVIWYLLAQLFKNRKESAIATGYILLAILLLGNIIASGINIILILIYAYFFYLIYRVSKNKQVSS